MSRLRMPAISVAVSAAPLAGACGSSTTTTKTSFVSDGAKAFSNFTPAN